MEWDRVQVQRAALDTGEVENVIQQREQSIGGVGEFSRATDTRAAPTRDRCRAQARSCPGSRSSACAARGSSSPGLALRPVRRLRRIPRRPRLPRRVLGAVMSLYVDTEPPPRMGLSWISMVRPLSRFRSTRRGWNLRAWAIRSAICTAGSPGPSSPRSATTRTNSSKGCPTRAKSGASRSDVERPAVPGGQAQLAVERHQALPHALQRGLQQRRLLRHLRLAAPRHLEQPRVLQRRGGLAGQRGEQARLGLGVRVDLLV